MSGKVAEVLMPALKMRRSQRARIASELLASLDGPADVDAKRAWAAEVRRRASEVRSGAVKLEDWATVREQIAKDLRRK